MSVKSLGWMAMTMVLVAGWSVTQGEVPSSLRDMADTELEFARTAKAKGIRDSFLDFFAPDAIAFTPDVTSARDRLLKQESTPFSVNELLWEPRTGDVASSGEIGWLTGPSTFIDHASTDQSAHYGNYLSVWRKQPDGRWRVFIDVGASIPSEAEFAPGFTRMALPSRYGGQEDKTSAGRSLIEADRQLNARIASAGAPAAYAEVVVAGSRLHRPGSSPSVGPAAIGAWMEKNGAGLSTASTSGEASASGDLGYTYGKFEVKKTPPESGAYVRIWSRDAAGRWLLVADVIQPVRRPPA